MCWPHECGEVRGDFRLAYTGVPDHMLQQGFAHLCIVDQLCIATCLSIKPGSRAGQYWAKQGPILNIDCLDLEAGTCEKQRQTSRN